MIGTSTQWPEGVIARYLTVGGATVDITRVQSERYESLWSRGELVSSVDVTFTLRCTGELCPVKERFTRTYKADTVDDNSGGFDVEKLQRQAQSHAEWCRAMPKPETAR